VNKAKKTESFNPEKYGMAFCPGCGGSGRSSVADQGINVCKVCGGFGLIRKEDTNRLQFVRVGSLANRVIS